MRNSKTLLALIILFAISTIVLAQEFYLDKFEQVEDLKVFQSLEDDSKWYYLADQVRIGQKNGKPQLSFMKFVTNQDTGSEGGITGALGGGVIHILVEFHTPQAVIRQAEQELQRKHAGATIVGPIVYRSGTFALISATLDEEGNYADKVVGVGRAPVMEGHKAAISILLSKAGAQLLWESFKMATPDISINFEMEIAGYREPFNAKVTGDWNLISKNSSMALGLKTSMIGLDVQKTVSELRQTNAIKVDVKGSDPLGDQMVTQIEGKLVDYIFDKIGDPKMLQSLVEDKNLFSNVERVNRLNQPAKSSSTPKTTPKKDTSFSSVWQFQPIEMGLQLKHGPSEFSPPVTIYNDGRNRVMISSLMTSPAEGLDEENQRQVRAAVIRILSGNSTDSQRKEECKRVLLHGVNEEINYNYRPTERFENQINAIFRDNPSSDIREASLMVLFTEATLEAIGQDMMESALAEINSAGGGGDAQSVDDAEDTAQTAGDEPSKPDDAPCQESDIRTERATLQRELQQLFQSGEDETGMREATQQWFQQLCMAVTGEDPDEYRIKENVSRAFQQHSDAAGRLSACLMIYDRAIAAMCRSEEIPLLNFDEAPKGDTAEIDQAPAGAISKQGAPESKGGTDTTSTAGAAGKVSSDTAETGVETTAGEPTAATETATGDTAQPTTKAAAVDTAAAPKVTPAKGAASKRSKGSTAKSGSTKGRKTYDQKGAKSNPPAFSLMAAYRVKKFKTSGTFSFSFNKKALDKQAITMAYNVGDFYRRYGSDPAIFREVNIDDPVYKQREIIVFLDGQDKDAFTKYINYVTVSLRKRHQNGQLTIDEVRIDRNNFNEEGNIFRMLYGWKGDSDRERWLNYQYKTTWSYHGGHTYESDWMDTSDFNITASPPHGYRTIKLEADPDILRDEGVRLTTITFYYSVLGKEMSPIQVSMRTNADELSAVIEYFHDVGVFDYEYELKWRVQGQYITSGRLMGDEDFIFIDEFQQ
jgi:hypothetical protein